MIVFAADLSLSSTGWAVGESGKIVASGILPGKHVDMRRLIYLRGAVCDKIDTVKPDLILFEDLAVSRNLAYAKEIAGMAYMIRAELVQDGLPYILVAPNSLKKFVCKSGGSKKNPVKKEHMLKFMALAPFNHNVDSNDECDALGLAYIGMALADDWATTNQAQADVIKALRATNKGVQFKKQEITGW